MIRPRIAPPAPPGEPEEPKAPKRWPLWVLAGVIVGALLVAAGVWISRDPSPAPAPTATPSPSPTPTPSPTATPSPSPTPTPTATPTPAPAPTDDVERAVTLHWSLIEQGRYRLAYDALAPGLQARIPRAGWIRAQRQDRLSDVSLEPTAELGPEPGTARVAVASMRTEANSGCFTWTGAYELQFIDGVWRISGSKLTRRPC